MSAAQYTFTGTWIVAAGADRVRDVVVDLEQYPQWWPQIRAVASLGPNEARVLCRSSLPYTLDLVLRAITRDRPVLEVEVAGDLDGWVRWRLIEVPEGTRMEFTQHVVVTGPLAWASRVARPVLRWNHDRMMAGCLTGLRARLAAG